MRRLMLLILIPIAIILFSVVGLLVTLRSSKEATQKANGPYEYYLGKEIYGTEVTTLMNKAINENEKNKIQKDERGYYIENDENSFRIELKMITIDKTYAMEEIYNNDMNRFLENFNLIRFKCTNIEYHPKTGMISKMLIEQLEY